MKSCLKIVFPACFARFICACDYGDVAVKFLQALLLAGCLAASKAFGDGVIEPVVATLDLKTPGERVAPEFSGLSFETLLLLPGKDGQRYFRPENKALIQLFHTLEIKSLRIGGNTSDRDARELPGPADWDSLFAFARAAQVKVIYCLQLHRGDPQVAARTVKYIMDHYAPWMDCFSIGQEPSAYPVLTVDDRPASERMGGTAEKFTYTDYARDWRRFSEIIAATVPGAKFCGPGIHNNPAWTSRFINDFGRGHQVALVTEHLYPGGAGGLVSSPEIGRAQMLAGDFLKTYQGLYDGFVPLALSQGLSYRLEEANNFYNGGATNVSNTTAAALWGLEFLHWWAAHHAAGVNFHTGDQVAAGSLMKPCRYTAFCSTPGGYLVRPLGYALKAFDLASHGKSVPVRLTGKASAKAGVYAVLGNEGDLWITLINKRTDAAADSTPLVLELNDLHYRMAESMSLNSAGESLADLEGQALGGSAIDVAGQWRGNWTQLPVSARQTLAHGVLSLNLRPASAQIIRLSPDATGQQSVASK